MTWTIFRWELRLLTRGAPFWLAVLTAAGIGVHIARQDPGSPFLVAFGLAGWALPVIPILFLPVLGAVRRRDEAAGVQELIMSRPVGAPAYVLGKFLAAWAAMALAWLISLAACSAFLLQWPTSIGMSAVLLLPSYGFLAALCVAVDAITGRAGAVLAAGVAFILGGWLYHPAYWASYLLPGFLSHWVSDLYGFAPYTYAMMGNKSWALALALGLLALAVWLLPRRTPVLAGAPARRLTTALAAAAVLGGTAAIVVMWPAPHPGGWMYLGSDWEHEQVRAALAGNSRYWQRYGDLYLAPFNARYAEPMQAALDELRPYFPDLSDTVLVEGSYAEEPELEGQSVIMTDGMVTSGTTARRAVLRALADARWSQYEARRPQERLIEEQRGYYSAPDGTTKAPSLYHQWVVLERLAGPQAVAEEQQLFRDAFNADRELSLKAFDTLRSTRAVGRGISSGSQPALVLWNVGQRVGHDRLLAELEKAWSARPIFAPWEAVGQALGIDLAPEPDWPPRGRW